MTVTSTTIDEAYATRYPKSAQLFEEQKELTPGGFTHTSRTFLPFPLFITANRGSRKWDADGFEYIDYWLGHGAMLHGHAHPAIVQATVDQAVDGFHGGGETPIGLEWMALLKALVPSAEMVRYVASGGEATQMAIRVARGYTGKDRILKFEGGFHGWHDAATIGVAPPYDVPWSVGVPSAVQETITPLPFNDLDAVEAALDRYDDVAAILLEPGGLMDDTVPSDPAFLAGLRDLTQRTGAVLIFDEVVTGFRYAKGGAQEYFGVVPDLTALGKVIGGGLPAGAIVGRREFMEVMEWRPDPEWSRFQMIPHPGTWNANPGVAAAGVAALKLVRDTDAVEQAITQTHRLVEGCNQVFARVGVDAFAYARGSIFKLCRGIPPAILSGDFSDAAADAKVLQAGWGALSGALRKALLLEGVDLMRTAGFVSAAHTDEDIQQTCEALERSLLRLRGEGAL